MKLYSLKTTLKSRTCDGCSRVMLKQKPAFHSNINWNGRFCKVYFHSKECFDMYLQRYNNHKYGNRTIM